MVTIEPLRTEHIESCVAIMQRLPAWFGIEQAIVNYAQDLTSCDGFVATIDRDVTGFIGLKRFGANSIEVNVMGVLPEHRRKGIGTQLLRAVEEEALRSGVGFLHTKTLSPSVVDEAYEQTRAFWKAEGFIALDEHMLWGPSNPCLVLIKVLV
jgi:GNAT superfamily N-acetyltransferase